MTDPSREFETLVAQHPSEAFHAVPHALATALLTRLQRGGRMTPHWSDALRRAVNACCTCGGMGPDDPGVCPACLVWHLLSQGREAHDKAEAALAAMTAKRNELFEIATKHGRELAALKGRTCATCRHQYLRPYDARDGACGLTRMTDGVHPTVTIVPCRFLGFTCGAWQAREGA